MPCLVLVPLPAARAVQNDFGSFNGGVDPFARRKITGHELDSISALSSAPAEYSNFASGVQKLRDDESPKRAGAACDQYRCHQGFLPQSELRCHIRRSWRVTSNDTRRGEDVTDG
jgi:hypothetical protein